MEFTRIIVFSKIFILAILLSSCKIYCKLDPRCRPVKVNGRIYFQKYTNTGWQYSFQRNRVSKAQQQNGTCVQPIPINKQKRK